MPVIVLPGAKDRAVNEREALPAQTDSLSTGNVKPSAVMDSLCQKKDSLSKVHQSSLES